MAENKPKILVVDDMRSMRLTLSAIMEDRSYEVHMVEDGYQAIEAVRERAFDLVLMDIKMPGINGVQSFREIKRIRPGSVVVMMTGFSVEDLVKEALEEGAFSVIYKPLNIEEVIRLVESVPRTVLILVVDDRASDREVLSQILRDKGYRVAEAADGNEAIRMAKDQHYEIIFMDIKLPDRDGFSVFQEIRGLDPQPRVIFMTGFVLEDSIRRALGEGAYPVAYKPLDIESVLALVKQIILEKAR